MVISLKTFTVNGLEYVLDGQTVRGGITANNVRNKAADYFLTDGFLADVKNMNSGVHQIK